MLRLFSASLQERWPNAPAAYPLISDPLLGWEAGPDTPIGTDEARPCMGWPTRGTRLLRRPDVPAGGSSGGSTTRLSSCTYRSRRSRTRFLDSYLKYGKVSMVSMMNIVAW